MSTAISDVAAIAGSAPISLNAGPTTWLISRDRYGTDAMMPATGMKIGPMLCSPSMNCFPSPRSLSRMAAMAPSSAHAITIHVTMFSIPFILPPLVS